MPVINLTSEVPAPSAQTPPCADWPITWICDVSAASPAVTGLAVTLATSVLWSLTGMRFGVCEVTTRPCRDDCYSEPFYTSLVPWTDVPSGSFGYPYPALIGGSWFNLGCGSCNGMCSCSTVPEVRLPAPVYQVTEVKIDGVALPVTSYRLDNNRLLVRTDGELWPICNDLNLEDTEPGTWSITAQYGEPIPSGASLAMGQLACEIIRSASGEDCALPPGVTQLIRQGVTIQYPDVGELFGLGRTGLYLVDMFVSTWNPYNLRQRSRVYSVDRPQVRRAGT